MKLFFFSGILVLILMFSAFSQITVTPDNYTVFDGKGSASSIEKIIESAGNVDVLFLGEMHDDAAGHALQFEIFKKIVEKYGAQKKIGLSMEMFERDNQMVVDEYLAGLITEKKFLDDSRPWGNYKTDYRPLVELAKEKKLAVIAANAPRRYVNMVSRKGRTALDALSKDAKKFLAPLPYPEPSDAYSKKFRALMGSSPEAMMGIENILSSQALWDASMAYSITQALKHKKADMLVQLNGSFHSENRLGTAEKVIFYRPKAKILVVTVRYEEDFKSFDAANHTNLGDFVILTDTKIPRSKR